MLQSAGLISCCPGSQQEAERILILPNTGQVIALSLSLHTCKVVIVIPTAPPPDVSPHFIQVIKLGREETGRKGIAEGKFKGEEKMRQPELEQYSHCIPLHGTVALQSAFIPIVSVTPHRPLIYTLLLP